MVAPMHATYNGRDVLDYMWAGPGIQGVVATPPDLGYLVWDLIDHAPIELQ